MSIECQFAIRCQDVETDFILRNIMLEIRSSIETLYAQFIMKVNFNTGLAALSVVKKGDGVSIPRELRFLIIGLGFSGDTPYIPMTHIGTTGHTVTSLPVPRHGNYGGPPIIEEGCMEKDWSTAGLERGRMGKGESGD